MPIPSPHCSPHRSIIHLVSYFCARQKSRCSANLSVCRCLLLTHHAARRHFQQQQHQHHPGRRRRRSEGDSAVATVPTTTQSTTIAVATPPPWFFCSSPSIASTQTITPADNDNGEIRRGITTPRTSGGIRHYWRCRWRDIVRLCTRHTAPHSLRSPSKGPRIAATTST